MTDETENLVLTQLRALREDIARVENRLVTFQTETRQRFTTLDIAISSIESNTAAMRADQADLRTRIERLERRLDLVESE